MAIHDADGEADWLQRLREGDATACETETD
jgi:hypothetical protein